MKLRIYLITAAIALILAVCDWFIDPKISYGLLLSACSSLVNILLLTISMKSAIGTETVNYAALMTGNILRFGILLAVIFVAVKNPQYFNMIGVAVGFTLFFIALLIDALSRKGRKTV
ncbi:MAG: ATP synthase subunit I [Erysipelotrichaceae bacterium]|nr:ATP synthase subunit I [Erysipelotrichaceae bacterium]